MNDRLAEQYRASQRELYAENEQLKAAIRRILPWLQRKTSKEAGVCMHDIMSQDKADAAYAALAALVAPEDEEPTP
jgi:hypothetical protein